MINCFLIRLGEMTLKGKNYQYFEKLLENSIKYHFPSFKLLKDRMKFILFPDKSSESSKEASNTLKIIFGIHSFSPGLFVEKNLDKIKGAVLTLAEKLPRNSIIKIDVHRGDKSFPLKSPEITKLIASFLEKNGFVLSPKKFTHKIEIDILHKGAVVFLDRIKGAGGLPVGSSSRVLLLLSGGLDSPVAALLLMKRGAIVDFLHIHPFGNFDEFKKSKLLRMFKKLNSFQQNKGRLFVYPYTHYLSNSFKVPSKYDLVLFRRFMYRIAFRVAEKFNILALASGDSLGQVASQTLENIHAVDNLPIPVLRPLISMDKEEIIDISKKFGLYDISLENYKDCCSLISSKHPETKAKRDIIDELYSSFNFREIEERTLKDGKIIFGKE